MSMKDARFSQTLNGKKRQSQCYKCIFDKKNYVVLFVQNGEIEK